MITYSCGCRNETHEPTGALRSVSKCQGHARKSLAPEQWGERHYTSFGLIRNGQLQPTHHVEELTEALGKLPSPNGNIEALEVGCGVSPYAGVLIERGWHYSAIEPSRWAAEWMRRTYGVEVLSELFEHALDADLPRPFGLILAAHSIEHMDDAPGAIERCAQLLAPEGELWIVIPDDTDPVNPDHKWFFNQESLWFTVEEAGLTVEKIEMRRIVAHENFQFVRARKPSQEAQGQSAIKSISL